MQLALLWLVSVATIAKSVDPTCDLDFDLVREIHSYQPIVDKIVDTLTQGDFKGRAYDELAHFIDKFGSRLTGTQNLEDAIDYLLELMRKNDLENVNGEEVTVTRWNRLLEAGELTEPRSKSIALTALGSSVSTPVGGLEAEVAVVRSFAELDRGNFTGKIVVINQEFNGYDHDYMYRSNGATEASKKGAVAALVRALTPFSMYGLYTGQQTYRNNVTKIPAASITKEDAQMMQRMQDRGERIVMRLQISTESLDNSTSRNAVGEVVGLTEPNKVVVVSAHTDSWDVGLGAMDDGGGVFMSVYSLVVLKALGLRPRRTLRTILFTGEEQCYCGVNDYNEAHLDELDDFVFVMESDEGTWNPLGLSYTAGTRGGCVLQEILKLLAPLNATKAVRVDNVGSDISLWTKSLLPGASLLNENDRWYWFQHNEADTMDVMDRDAMDKATAVWTSVAYVIADLRLEFPKERD